MSIFTFGDNPEIGFAIPFENGDFSRFDGALPEEWAKSAGSPTGDHADYRPGFALTGALDISDVGVDLGSGAANTLENVIDMPGYILDEQVTRLGAALWGDLADGSHGAGKPVIKVFSGSTELCNVVSDGDEDWILKETNSTVDIDTGDSTMKMTCQMRSSGGSTDPRGLFDLIFLEYGRTAAERFYTFTHRPSFQGLKIFPQTFGKSRRAGRAQRQRYDTTGGAVKWTVVFPFVNVPEAFVEVLMEFWRRNKGLDGNAGIPLVLHHYIQDPNASHTDGEDWIRRPPWIICDIKEETFPFYPSGSFLGAKMFSGALTFEEI